MYGFEHEIRGNTERYVKKLYDLSGNHVGTISISRPRKARDILKADLKYLKALFDRLQSEKENAGKAVMSEPGSDSGVMLSLGGADMPVVTGETAQADVGSVVDAEA